MIDTVPAIAVAIAPETGASIIATPRGELLGKRAVSGCPLVWSMTTEPGASPRQRRSNRTAPASRPRAARQAAGRPRSGGPARPVGGTMGTELDEARDGVAVQVEHVNVCLRTK
jgi:hypothetical protein